MSNKAKRNKRIKNKSAENRRRQIVATRKEPECPSEAKKPDNSAPGT